jgi:hypothetical protein
MGWLAANAAVAPPHAINTENANNRDKITATCFFIVMTSSFFMDKMTATRFFILITSFS